ncbi:MAG TPA: DUF1566 domain-containing protein [Chitinophagaceae bacterium]|nr:DUF1566 domain-containing protein [Chitinophagaceae bacterium]
MKKILQVFVAVILTNTLFAQAPLKMSYQAVIRNGSNALVMNSTVGMKISILQGSATSRTPVYAETQTPTTNANGLVSLQIGGGTVVSGAFSTINWANGPYFIKTETDITGGTNYTITNTSQLLSVPYSLYSENSGNSTPGPQGSMGLNGHNTVTKTTTENAGINCTAGGVKLEYGLDSNNNGVLDVAEINTALTKYVCNGDTGLVGPVSGSFTHYAGELYGGGIVFHVYRGSDGAEHGLIVSLTDIGGTGVQWGLNGTDIPNCESTWNGASNTSAIINAGGLPTNAAGLCDNFVAGGQNDWYLPSITELSKLWDNLYNVNKTLSVTAGASVIEGNHYYWSSTEADTQTFNASTLLFFTGQAVPLSKNSTLCLIRAVRAF